MTDIEQVTARVPLLGNFKPFGQYVMNDLHQIGGLPMVMKTLLDAGFLHGDCLTVTGGRWPRTWLMHRYGQKIRMSSTARSSPMPRRISISASCVATLLAEGCVLEDSAARR